MLSLPVHIASTGCVHARIQDTITTTITVLVMCVVAASVTDVASLNATNTSITIPEGTKQPANPDSGCGCLLLRTAMLKM